jgi:hypothetical protein
MPRVLDRIVSRGTCLASIRENARQFGPALFHVEHVREVGGFHVEQRSTHGRSATPDFREFALCPVTDTKSLVRSDRSTWNSVEAAGTISRLPLSGLKRGLVRFGAAHSVTPNHSKRKVPRGTFRLTSS